ncbi:MAG: glycosyltransferase [Gemmataceae bacterium]|nr:glycosyltransferase [Gemmataceae bacterium]
MTQAKQLLRLLWHPLNRRQLLLNRKLERASIKLRAMPMKWLRRNWPNYAVEAAPIPRVAIVTVNYNTAERLADLVFSLYRILGRQQFARFVVVDNGSRDGSVELLTALQQAGLADVIFNSRQRYHGPALNQAFGHCADLARSAARPEERIDYIWVLDSDTLVLREDAVTAAVRAMRTDGSSLIGQFQYDVEALPQGYAHISSLLIDPQQVWQRRVEPFQESGTPGEGMQISLRSQGFVVSNFPYRNQNYVLHLGMGTLQAIREKSDSANRYYDWASKNHQFHYHGNPFGPRIYTEFRRVMQTAVPTRSLEQLVSACEEPERLRLHLPEFAPPREEASVGGGI